MAKEIILSIGITFSFITGCTNEKMSKTQIIKYFSTCPKGTHVNIIETDLKLPDPVEEHVPAMNSPYWKMRYLSGDLMIYFEADLAEYVDTSGNSIDYERSDLVYVGQVDILTKKEYLEVLEKKRFRN